MKASFHIMGFPCGLAGKESACNVGDLGWEDPQQEWKAPYSSILAWRIPWTVQSTGSQRVRHVGVTLTSLQHHAHQPLNAWESIFNRQWLCPASVQCSIQIRKSALLQPWQPIQRLYSAFPDSPSSIFFLSGPRSSSGSQFHVAVTSLCLLPSGPALCWCLLASAPYCLQGKGQERGQKPGNTPFGCYLIQSVGTTYTELFIQGFTIFFCRLCLSLKRKR